MEKLAQFLNDITPSKILDVGTGSGNFIDLINTIYKEYETIVGIDTFDAAIESATNNFKDNDRISFIKMDASTMTFEKESFDLVCLSNSLHHLEDTKIIFTEMDQVLKKGGYLLFAEMMSNNLSPSQQSHLLLHHFAAKIDRLQGQIHNDTYKDETILKVCEENSDLTLFDNWVLHYERKKENSDEEIQWLLNTVDKLTKKVANKDIFIEAEEIKKYIKQNGFDSCPTMIVVMKK
jgi:ubiquinone/menaquinone biosynthesis C-methylase UbiE